MCSKQLILFIVTFLLCLTFAFAQETQQDSNKQRPPRPNGSMPPRPMPSGGMPPKPQDSHMPPRPTPQQSGQLPPRPKPQHSSKPPKKQQDESQQSNTESAQDDNNSNLDNNERESRQNERGFPFGMILAIIGGIVLTCSTCLICGASITFCILKKKGYSISLQKKESHQPLREEEEMPSQFMAQVPVVYSQTPIVHYPIIQQQQHV
ncbi:predicted protein [Naegleria gruberi]|uniref:Predicted protein n=1 Tax=Naegleria gruberi TaxID=5762 RepID=D2V1S0_NAEGR|nr:uncharacterized protein NAEGRDRAFT_62673 [Naegleria gruberi]EFC49360.1 predicted protein [Naegleria gruberi]|eukprot:XP_002682104.1 predicted protein [Naegleria gruberi strain NEG-M]